MVTLGLDASTTTIGWSFFSDKLLDCGFVDIKKIDSNKDKAYHFIDYIKKNSHFKDVDNIVLEAALSSFMGGFTRQQVIIKLIKWNAIFEYILNEEFPNMGIHLLGVNTIRKNVFGKCRITGMKSKEFVKYNVENMISDISERIILNRKGNPDKRNEDMYDAIVCSMYTF
jgi:TATA-box binding protein (TBP) (component of TFIID and TFIIIB)